MSRTEKKYTEKLDTSLKLIFKSSIVVFIGIIISKIVFYIYRVIIARTFGPEVYGLFSLSLMILTFLVMLFSLGLSEGLIRFIPLYSGRKQTEHVRFLIKLSRRAMFISSILAFIILFFSSGLISEKVFHNPQLTIFLQISSLSIPFWVLSKVYLAILRAYEKISLYSFIVNILQGVVILATLAFFIWMGYGSDKIMLSYFVGVFAMFFVAYCSSKYFFSGLFKNPKLKKNTQMQIKREFYFYSIPMMFSSVISILYYWVDSFILGYYLGAYEVGIYNAAVPIVVLFAAIPDLFIQLFYPLVTKEFSRKNFRLVKEISKQVAKWIFILVLPVFLIVFIFPGAVINLLFGQQYLPAEGVLRILSVGGIISIFTGFLLTLLSIAGKSKMILMNMIVTSIVNLILNLLLVPKIGLIGAAIATSITWGIFTIVLLFEVYRTVGFLPLRKKMLRIVLISLIPTIILITIKQFVDITLISLTLLGVFFILTYLFTIFITGCFDKHDLMILKSIKKKLSRQENN